MRLARVIRTGGIWALIDPQAGAIVRCAPAVGAIVQYEDDYGAHRVYFPGVSGAARIGVHLFREYFEDLDNETS